MTPWWKTWEEIKNKPIDPAIKPLAKYLAAGLKAICSLPRLPKSKVMND
jgi:hypothetical protein